eukprot:2935508-Rhodomonas_salina.1
MESSWLIQECANAPGLAIVLNLRSCQLPSRNVASCLSCKVESKQRHSACATKIRCRAEFGGARKTMLSVITVTDVMGGTTDKVLSANLKRRE